MQGLYQDFDLVFAQPNGRPIEERVMDRAFEAFIEENGLPKVVFHSLRHLSTSEKLKASGGDTIPRLGMNTSMLCFSQKSRQKSTYSFPFNTGS